MNYIQVRPRWGWDLSLLIFSIGLWLFTLGIIGCVHAPRVVGDTAAISHLRIRPIDVSTSTAENIGHEALEKVGYDEIIKLANKAGFIEYKYSATIELISYGSEIGSSFTPVFSRYAVAAAVAAQADSPLPGPADIAAIGVLVLGLVDASLLDGYFLNTVTDFLVDSGALLMSENVIDTGVMEKVDQIIVTMGVPRTREVICTVLRQLFKEAEGRERDKIKRTQKGWDCRNTKKQRQ